MKTEINIKYLRECPGSEPSPVTGGRLMVTLQSAYVQGTAYAEVWGRKVHEYAYPGVVVPRDPEETFAAYLARVTDIAADLRGNQTSAMDAQSQYLEVCEKKRAYEEAYAAEWGVTV